MMKKLILAILAVALVIPGAYAKDDESRADHDTQKLLMWEHVVYKSPEEVVKVSTIGSIDFGNKDEEHNYQKMVGLKVTVEEAKPIVNKAIDLVKGLVPRCP